MRPDSTWPYVLPLVVIVVAGYAVFGWGLVKDTRVPRSVAIWYVPTSSSMLVVLTALRAQDLLLAAAGVSVILLTATAVTRGRVRSFLSLGTDEEQNVAAAVQVKTLLLAVIPLMVLCLVYRSLV